MTVALTLKVNDGLVLAADSASTLATADSVVNVYNNANKIFNLHKGLPIGLITWGLGSIGGMSISTLAKDLRRRFAGGVAERADWKLDPAGYAIGEVALRVREFMYEERYAPVDAASRAAGHPPAADLGFFVVGYSPGQDQAEEYHLDLQPSGCPPPVLLRGSGETGTTWAGQPEAISRLVSGHGLALPYLLQSDFGVAPADVPSRMADLQSKMAAPMVSPAMPIQDAIDLAEFLVETSIKFSRFMPGSPTVGGPVESAAISKHEGQVDQAKALLQRDAQPGGGLMQHVVNAPVQPSGGQVKVPLQPVTTSIHSSPSTSSPRPADS